MDRKIEKLLFDIDEAANRIFEFCQGKTLEDYSLDVFLRSAVERQLEIVGEAINRLWRQAPHIAEKVSDSQRIISFRNVLAHGYDSISDEMVWGIIYSKLPLLRIEIQAMMEAGETDPGR